MLRQKIEDLKTRLDFLVSSNGSYDDIYKISKELDKYITMYYEKNYQA